MSPSWFHDPRLKHLDEELYRIELVHHDRIRWIRSRDNIALNDPRLEAVTIAQEAIRDERIADVHEKARVLLESEEGSMAMVVFSHADAQLPSTPGEVIMPPSLQSDPRLRQLRAEFDRIHFAYRAMVWHYHATHEIILEDRRLEAAITGEEAIRKGKISEICELARELLEHEEAFVGVSAAEIASAVFGECNDKNNALEIAMNDKVRDYWDDLCALYGDERATEADLNETALLTVSGDPEAGKAFESSEIARQELFASETPYPRSPDALLAGLRREHDLISARYCDIVRPLYTTDATSERVYYAKIAAHREIRESQFAEIYEQAKMFLRENDFVIPIAEGDTFADTVFKQCIYRDVALEAEMLAQAREYWRGAGGHCCETGGISVISQAESDRTRMINKMAEEQAAEMGLEADQEDPREALRKEWKRRVIEGRVVRVAGEFGVDEANTGEMKEKWLGRLLGAGRAGSCEYSLLRR